MDGDVFPGWVIWQVTLDRAGNSKILPSKTVANGLDSGVNLLGKPNLDRGGSTPWDPGDVVTLNGRTGRRRAST